MDKEVLSTSSLLQRCSELENSKLKMTYLMLEILELIPQKPGYGESMASGQMKDILLEYKYRLKLLTMLNSSIEVM